jgi:site-specific recombinase XerD
MEEVDINNKKKTWIEHKKKDIGQIKEVSTHNSKLIKEFLNDYEMGINVGIFKGRRRPATLTKLRHQLIFFNNQLNKNLDEVQQKDLHKLFFDMEEGTITKSSGKRYLGVGEFVKSAKSFYGWLNRTHKREDNPTKDLSIDVSNGGGRKPHWVYLDNEKMKTIIDNARGDYRALILFLYDSGLRPQEAWRIRISDFSEDYSVLDIPEIRENKERVSKTFSRKIKLTQCSKLIKGYIQKNKLSKDDLLITKNQPAFNRYLGRTAKRLFGDNTTKARGRYDQLKSYDIRHNSAVYYLNLYKTNKDLMYRFGWKKEDKIFYYTEFLGIQDKIDEDMLTPEDKNKVAKMEKNMKILTNTIRKIVKKIDFNDKKGGEMVVELLNGLDTIELL